MILELSLMLKMEDQHHKKSPTQFIILQQNYAVTKQFYIISKILSILIQLVLIDLQMYKDL